MMRRAGSYLVCFALVALSGCQPPLDTAKYDAKATSITVSGGTVYTAGWRKDGDGAVHACFWRGSSRRDLDANAVAYGIFAAGGSVYVAGEAIGSTYSEALPCYWQDSVRTELMQTAGYANAIFVSGGTIYCAGGYSTGTWIPAFWNGVSVTALPGAGGSNSGYGTSVFVSGGNVYTAGQYYNGVGWVACYWTNSTRTDLPGGSAIAKSISVSGGVVYTCGEYFTGTFWLPCYWTNNSQTSLSVQDGLANAVYCDGGSVYVTGAYPTHYQSGVTYWTPCYWKDGSFGGEFPCPTSTDAASTSICVVGGVVYASGFYYDGSNYVPCYWSAGTRTDLAGD